MKWIQLAADVAQYGMYNQNLRAVPPTGSISYINGSTSSIHPIASKIESARKSNRPRLLPGAVRDNSQPGYYRTPYEIDYEVSTPTLWQPSTAGHNR